MIPSVFPTVKGITHRLSCWLIFRQEELIHRLAPDYPVFKSKSEFYIPLDELYMTLSSRKDQNVDNNNNSNNNNNNNNMGRKLSFQIESVKKSKRKRCRKCSNYPSSRSKRRVKCVVCLTKTVYVLKSKTKKSLYCRRRRRGKTPAQRKYVLRMTMTGLKEESVLILCSFAMSLCKQSLKTSTKISACMDDEISMSNSVDKSQSKSLTLERMINKFRTIAFSSKIKTSAPPPVVPIRTHSSSQRPSFHRPPPTPSGADPLTNITSSSLQKLMKSVTQNSVNISSKSKTLMETSSRNHIPLPSVDVLVLGENKSVPMNNLYKSLLDKPYFHAVTRNSLSNMLVEDGMYLVRPSTHSEHLLTLSIANNHKIFNIVIRKRDDSKFALGTQKAGEMSFFSVDEMVKFYHREAIKVEDGSLVYLKKLPYKDRN